MSDTSSRKAQRAEARARREAAERERAASERRARRLRLLGGAVVAAVAVVVVAIAVSSGGGGKHKLKAGARPPQSRQVAAAFGGIPQRGQTLGSARAPVTLVEFADLKCPVCRAYTLQALPTLLRDYVRPGKLRIVFQPQTFVGSPPGDSERAARFALAAGAQNKLWQFAELWYQNQQDENTAYATDSYIRQVASGVPGLDVNRAMRERSSPPVSGALDKASSMYHAAGFSGTPSFLLGGNGSPLRPLNAVVDPSQFTGPIDRLLRQ
jgi:protein-disulfide isomerase